MLDWICHQLRAVSLCLGLALQWNCVGELKHSTNPFGNVLIHVFSLMIHEDYTISV